MTYRSCFTAISASLRRVSAPATLPVGFPGEFRTKPLVFSVPAASRAWGVYRKSFSDYTELSLLLSAVFYGFMSTFFCGVFLVKHKIELIIAVPFVCGLFCLYLRICFRPDSAAQKPEKLFREKGLMGYVLILILLFLILLRVHIPFLTQFTATDLIPIR